MCSDVASAAPADGADEARQALRLAAYDYPLDPSAVAQAPCSPRDAARLLVLPEQGPPKDHVFRDLPQLLAPGDVLVVNETRVLPARLHIRRPSGAMGELLPFAPLVGAIGQAKVWRALGRPSKSLRPGTQITTAAGTPLRLLARHEAMALVAGSTAAAAAADADADADAAADGPLYVAAAVPLLTILQAEGALPLPPYVRRVAGPDASDAGHYQTLFARVPGAVAAPTASLHFTEASYVALRARGVDVRPMVLHVGPGTFLPVRREHENDVRGHSMHAEAYAIPEATLEAVRRARAGKRRVVAAGTTALRALETWAKTGRARGESRLFVRPGFQFAAVDALLTNFHLPRTTLLLLVAAFSGRQRILSAYAHAQRAGYRFFSYGDASLLLAPTPPRAVLPGEAGFVAKACSQLTL